MASLETLVCSKARAGRPRDAAKRQAIVEAARDLFYDRGVEATTIEDVAAAAGVSKVTVYNHFGDKLGLFEGAVRHAVSFMEQALTDAEPRGRSLSECLQAFGEALLGFLTSPRLIAFDRMLAGEAARHPELAERFFEAGPAYCLGKLAHEIAAAAGRGEVEVSDPRRAAEDLLGLWYGTLHKQLVLGRLPSPSPTEIRGRVRHGVQLFMRAYAPA